MFDRILLENDFIEVELIDLGATLVSFRHKQGKNILVRYKDSADYEKDQSVYLGKTIGPLAGRTRFGFIAFHDEMMQLSINNPPHHLHGGFHSTAFHRFSYRIEGKDKVVFYDTLDHSKDAYPGKISYTFSYSLDKDTLLVSLEAVPQLPMPLNLCNHAYFNLSQANHLKDHRLRIASQAIVVNDETLANTKEIMAVRDTVYDYNDLKSLDNPDLYLDHDFILEGSLTLENNEWSLLVETDAEVMHVYSANFFAGSFENEWGDWAANQSALALEAQNRGDAYNITEDERYLYGAERPFSSTARYTLTKK